MLLYFYNRHTGRLADVMEADGYNGDFAWAGDSTVYFDRDWEVSTAPDLGQALRAEWQAANPTQASRLEEVEFLLAELLFGGEPV